MSLWSSVLSLVGLGAARVAEDAAPAQPKAERERFRPPPLDLEALRALLAPRSDLPPDYNPFKPAARPVPPGVGGPGLAMDEAADFGAVASWAMGGLGALYLDREGFVGYPQLALLSQRPEYRAPVEITAEDATKTWIKFQSAGEKDKTAKISKIEDEFKRLNVREVFREASIHDGFYGRGHIYVDLGSTDDQPELTKPIVDKDGNVVASKIGRGKLKALRSVEPVWVWPQSYNSLDPLNEDWYRPTAWYVMQKQIHASRLMTFIGRPVADLLKPAYMFGGLSMTQMMRPVVENWLRTRKDVGDAIHAYSTMVFLTNMTEALNFEGSPASIIKRAELFNLMRDNRGLFMADKEQEDFKNVSMPLEGLSDLQAQSQEHMSCSEGTLIETFRGAIPIETVTTDDRVLTRTGFAPVKWAGITGSSVSFVEIEAGDAIIRVTENHPIWSQSTNEFVNAENVSLSHRLLALRTSSPVNTARASHGEVAGGGTLNAAIIEMKKLAAFCTMSFGRRIEGLFQKAMRSTIATTMEPTIAGITSNFSRALNMKRDITGSQRREFSLARHAETASRRCRKAAYGPVVNVESVPVGRVALLEVPRQPTYDIMVADGWPPEFFANGLLVHNCSLARIPVIRLLGIQPAGLNASSEGELTVYRENIRSYQESFFRPKLQQVLGIVQCSLFGDVDEDIEFVFKPLAELTELEKATLERTRAETATVHIGNKSISAKEERQRIAADPDTPYDSLDVEKGAEIAIQDAAQVLQQATAAITQAFGEGLTDRPTALRQLKAIGEAVGVDSQIDDALIAEAEEQPPAPNPQEMMGGGAPGGEGAAQGEEGGPAEGGGPKAGTELGSSEALVADAQWEESKHSRGQPENAGQFGPGGGSQGEKAHIGHRSAKPSGPLLGSVESRAKAKEEAVGVHQKPLLVERWGQDKQYIRLPAEYRYKENAPIRFGIDPDGKAYFEGMHPNPSNLTHANVVRAVQRFMNPLPENTFIRVHHDKKDYEALKAGTHRGSINHRTGEYEQGGHGEKGVSVSLEPEFPSKYGYYVKGVPIGMGSDGEPLLDPKNLEVVSPRMPYEKLAEDFYTKQDEKLKRLGLDQKGMMQALHSVVVLTPDAYDKWLHSKAEPIEKSEPSAADAQWEEGKHKRGQPENAGQFGPGGGGKAEIGHRSSQPSGPLLGSVESRARAKGEQLTPRGAEPLPEHIAALKIPPAWTDVHYNADPHGALLVTGRDAKGRRTAIYSPEHVDRAAQQKFARVSDLERKFRAITAENETARQSADPVRRGAADALALIAAMGIRPGSERDTKAAQKAYGATTLMGRHVVDDGERVSLKFTGKKGVALDLPVTDKGVAKMLRERAATAGSAGKLFGVSEKQLLDHVHSLDGGKFKTKDFRTYLAARSASEAMGGMAPPTTAAQYRKQVMAVAKFVSTRLGNTASVALKSYIPPQVFAQWRIAA